MRLALLDLLFMRGLLSAAVTLFHILVLGAVNVVKTTRKMCSQLTYDYCAVCISKGFTRSLCQHWLRFRVSWCSSGESVRRPLE